MKRIVLVILGILLVGCQLEPLSVEVKIMSPSTFEIGDGVIDLKISGGKPPYKIQLNGKEVSEVIGNLNAGVYDLIVFDAKKQVHTESITMIDPLHVEYQKVDVAEAFGDTGSISLDIKGGEAPYKITMNGSVVSDTITQLSSNLYEVTVEDKMNRSQVIKVDILEPTEAVINDQEGHEYNVVKIDQQWWMANNLKVTQDIDGNPITYLKFNGDNTLSKKYGYLYTYDVAMLPLIDGWRLPTDDEFKSLERFLGMSEEDIKKINSSERGHNISFKLLPEGDTGFNAELSGYYAPEHGFNGMKQGVAYMTSAIYESDTKKDHVIVRTIMKDDGRIYCYPDPKTWAFYVRLIKD